jgi:hypothetical protein
MFIWLKTVCLSFVVHFADCLTTGPQPFSKPVLYRTRSSASSFNWQYPLFYLRPSSSNLRLLPRLPISSNLPSVFPSITCFTRQFPRKMLPIQLACLLFTVCRIFLSFLAQCTTSSFVTSVIGYNFLGGNLDENTACGYQKHIQKKIGYKRSSFVTTVSAPWSQPLSQSTPT